MTTSRFKTLVLGTNLTGTDNGNNTITVDADAETLPASIVDAKGDLIAGTAADTVDNLPVGTNGQILTADSTQTTGLKWSPLDPSTATTWWFPLVDSDGTCVLDSDGDLIPTLVPLPI